MANEQNLRTPTSSEARENGKKGGRKSGETRRKKKAIREILNGYLDGSIKNNAQMQALARKLGLNDNATIKEVFVIGCMINSMKHGDLGTIGELSDLIGEGGAGYGEAQAEDDALTKALKEEAERMQNADIE